MPGIFRWSVRIPPSQILDTTLTSMDLLPLFCGLAGVALPSDRKFDGRNIFPILQGSNQRHIHLKNPQEK